MKHEKFLHKKRCFMIMVVCLAAGVALGALAAYCERKKQGIEDMGIATGVQNSCAAYDEETDTMMIGTHSNEIIAFQGETQRWRAKESGAFSEIVINKENGYTYAGNENGHVYVYQISDGTLVKDINVQRRIVGMDVSEDSSLIALATATGNQKSNALVVSADGEEILNLPSKIKVNGIKFAGDDKSVLIGNNRGDIVKIGLDGEEIGKYSTNYAVIQMICVESDYMVLCKNGGYFGFDENLNITRQGKIKNTAQAVVQCIGTDAAGEYVAVGSREGYVFVMDGKDKQIYTANTGKTISAFAPAGNNIYMTGLGEYMQILHTENLTNGAKYDTMETVSRWGARILLAAAAFFLFMGIPATGERLRKLGKSIWRHRMAYIFLLPSLLLVWFFNYRGIGIALTRAFTNWSATNNTIAKIDFVGLENFRVMVTEGYFLTGMKNLVLLVVTALIKALTVPVLVAWLVYAVKGGHKKYLYRFMFVLPVVVPGVISALTWQKIYDPNIGLLNEVLGTMGFTNLQHVWLGDANTAIWAVIFMGFPFISALAFLVYYGGFIGISKEIEESARVDGASRRAIFWKIQLPMIRPQISIMMTLTIIATMQDFNNIYILTGGGPGTSTYVPALELYFNVAQFGRYGYACALGVVLFLFTMIVTIINMRLTRERGDD